MSEEFSFGLIAGGWLVACAIIGSELSRANSRPTRPPDKDEVKDDLNEKLEQHISEYR